MYQQRSGEIVLPDQVTAVDLICARHFQDQNSNFSRDSGENWENCYDFARDRDDADNNVGLLDSVVRMTSISSQPYARMLSYY